MRMSVVIGVLCVVLLSMVGCQYEMRQADLRKQLGECEVAGPTTRSSESVYVQR